jgi:hypothetical protein
MRLILTENVDVEDHSSGYGKEMFLIGNEDLDPSTWLKMNTKYTHKVVAVFEVKHEGSLDSVMEFAGVPFVYFPE